MFSPDVLSEVVKNHTGFSPKGVSCYFIKLNEEWGLKVYTAQDERDRAYRIQTNMSKYNLAPTTGIKFDIGENYCYVTEVAIPLASQSPVTRDYTEEFYTINNDTRVRKMINDIVTKMKAKGHSSCDNHAGNFGILRKQLVCIDFGY